MEYAKKMMLVDPASSNVIPSKDILKERLQTPAKRELGNLDKEMLQVLHSYNLSDYEKVHQYNQILSKFQMANDTTHRSNTEVTQIDQPPTQNIESFSKYLPLNTIPKQYKQKANVLMDILKNSNTITWDSIGTPIIEGRKIVNDNITDYINKAVNPRVKLDNLSEWDKFKTQLQKLNIPKTLLSEKAINEVNINKESNRLAQQMTERTDRKSKGVRSRKKKANPWIPY